MSDDDLETGIRKEPTEGIKPIETDSELEDELAECEGLISQIEEITDDKDWVAAQEKVNDLQETVGRIHNYIEGKIE